MTYTALGHAELESARVPLSPNSLAFNSQDMDSKYNQRLLGLSGNPGEMSLTFKNNLVLFTVGLLLFAIVEVAGQSVLYYRQERISESDLNVHLISVTILLTCGLAILAAVRLSLAIRSITKKAYFAFCLCLSTYLIVTDQRILAAISHSDYSPNHCNNVVILMLFLYLYRLISFAYFLGVLVLSVYTLVLYLTLMVAYSPQDQIVTVMEFLFLALFCVLLCFNTHQTEFRARSLFYRSLQEEESSFHSSNASNAPTHSNKGFNTEAEKLIEMCENVRKKVKTAASVVIFTDIKSQLKVALHELDTIMEKLRKGNINEIVKLDLHNDSIDEEDMEFIRQQFYRSGENEKFTQHTGPIQYTNRRASVVNMAELGLDHLGGMLEEIGRSWGFDIWRTVSVSQHSVSIVGKYLFKKWDLLPHLKCPEYMADQFFLKVEKTYLDNPYHNACHAADVCHSFFYFLETANLLKKLSEIDMTACIIGALGHDIGHPGLTNRYLVNSKHKLAMRYNDSSVLENMHIAQLFKVMREPGRNLLEDLEKEDWTSLRKLLIELILHTDMSKHFETLGNFRTWAQANSLIETFDDKVMVLSMGLKCADIGHAAKSTELHMKWTELICEEFFHQGDLEKADGQPVSIYCDRATTDVAKSQAGFLKNICVPLYEAWTGFLSCGEISDKCMGQLNSNMIMWEGKTKARRASILTASVPIPLRDLSPRIEPKSSDLSSFHSDNS